MFPPVEDARLLAAGKRRAFIGAYGFEERSLGWCNMQRESRNALTAAYVFKYMHPKGPNRVEDLRKALKQIGATVRNIQYNNLEPQLLEDSLPSEMIFDGIDEVIVDISAMTKLAILLVLNHLRSFKQSVRIVYSEANDYCPSREEFDPIKRKMAATARFPSRGAEQVVRLRCLASIRMQGQPITLVAFTSFNEKLISHMLGFISPHRLILINGRPPRSDYVWREAATYEIYKRLADEYAMDNPLDEGGLLQRVASTLDYRQAFQRVDEIYSEYGLFERLICGATGSKMQTVGLFFAKARHGDIQIEYPTPDSYFVTGMTSGIRNVYETKFENFGEFIAQLVGTGKGAETEAVAK